MSYIDSSSPPFVLYALSILSSLNLIILILRQLYKQGLKLQELQELQHCFPLLDWEAEEELQTKWFNDPTPNIPVTEEQFKLSSPQF
jgi:hypothetical protein